MEYADETVFTFARAMVQIKQLVLIKWCGVYSNQMIIKDSFEMCGVNISGLRLLVSRMRYARTHGRLDVVRLSFWFGGTLVVPLFAIKVSWQ